jgi:tRNA(Ile)-lysidine synthase
MKGVAPQNRHVASVTQAFLNVHWDQKEPLVVGLSGGPDSMALFYALLDCGVKPHIAHVDHGWRENSGEEAEILQREAEKWGCPFHTTKLQLEEKSEDAARKGRYAFFQSLPYKTVLLAHQAEDLAETVLKRIFEGAHLPFLGGMEPVSRQGDLILWRPFLKIRRKEILAYLGDRPYFTDPSNSDPQYLRARMRSEIFPFLTEKFGKEIVGNLVLLSERAHELKQYFEEKTKAPEWRYGLQKEAKKEGTFLSREELEQKMTTIFSSPKSSVLGG